MKTRKNFFTRRAKNLKKIGYSSYEQYLNSQLWKNIRTAILKRRKTCKKCGDKSRVVHHLNYSKNTLLGRNPAALMALCFLCHDEISVYARSKNIHDALATTLYKVIQ